MRSTTLLTEVLEAVVHANKGDPRTLAACGAAGKQFLSQVEYTFPSVHLHSPSGDKLAVESYSDTDDAVFSLDLAPSSGNDLLPSFFPLAGAQLIALSHLRHLRITVSDVLSMTIDFVELCAASLVQLDLRFTHWSSVWDRTTQDHTVSLTHLSTLRFETSVRGAIGAILLILRLLTAPALTEVIFSRFRIPTNTTFMMMIMTTDGKKSTRS
ncbi:hypothetical protein B0H11DRAFT_2434303 [Mycena galericulata]|nr:hypothetical protein B0H11DRAFT_2434303 [Mycena galericulata]